MMLIDLEALPNPETGDAELRVFAPFLQLFFVRVWMHSDSPRSVLFPKGTERIRLLADLALCGTSINILGVVRVFSVSLT